MSLTLGEIVRDHLSEKHGKEGFIILCLTKRFDVNCTSERVWSDPIEAEKSLCAASEDGSTASNEVQLYILYDLGRKLILWVLSPS